MFSFFLARVTLSIQGKSTGKYSYMFYDDRSGKTFELIDKLWTKVRIDGNVKNIDEVSDLDSSIEITNDRDSKYVLVKHTLTNKASTEKKIDLSTALHFKEEDNFLEATTIPNFGFYLNFDRTWENTVVLRNHPLVNDINVQDFDLEGEPRFFTNNDKILEYGDTIPGIMWMSFSWLNKYIQPGKSITLTYMIHDDDYEPPLLKLDKSLINEEADTTEPIHLKGSFSFHVEYFKAEAYWEIFDSNGKSVKYGQLGYFRVSSTKNSMDFDVIVNPPEQLGKYTLQVYTYLAALDAYLIEEFPITVVAPNCRPKLYIFPLEYTFYIPNSEVSFSATAFDADLGDKPLTTKIFFNNQEVSSQEVANNKDVKTLKFKVPQNTRAGEYEVKVTATDGKKIGTKKFNIVIKDNTVLTIDFEPALNSTYKKGEKVSFTAVINDPDTNFDNKFTVSLYYNDKLKRTLSNSNDAGLVRIPLDFTIPSDETFLTAEVKLKVETPTESNEKVASINILQDDTSGDLATGKIAAKEQKKKNALVAVLCVLAVLAVIAAVVVIILWIKTRN